MVERTLALDDDPVAEILALLDHPLDGALGEVGDKPVHRDAPALDHHPGLAGRHERGRVTRLEGCPSQFECDGHLADRAVGPDGQDDALPRLVPSSDGRLHPLRRSPIVDDPRAACLGFGGEFRVVGEERVETG